VASDRSQANDDDTRVIPFRRPGSGSRWPFRTVRWAAPPLEDLGRYQGADHEDNYRHRMIVNLAALALTIVLSIIGVWLVSQIADMRKNQDCVLSGHRNCAGIDVHAKQH
jgi:hypothetical protein